MAESKLRDLSMDFSIEILRICDGIKGHSSIVNQLERSGTSIGANIREANYAQGKKDFVSKLQIALKECCAFPRELKRDTQTMLPIKKVLFY